MSLVSQPIGCSSIPVPVFLLFALSFITCIFFCKRMECNHLLWVELYFSINLVLFSFFGSVLGVWKRGTAELYDVWNLLCRHFFLSWECVRVCPMTARILTRRLLPRPLLIISQLKASFNPKWIPSCLSKPECWSFLVEQQQILKWTKKIQGTYSKSSEAIWYFYVRRRAECIVFLLLQLSNVLLRFTYLKKQCHIDNRPGVIKVFQNARKIINTSQLENLNFSLFYGDLFPPALEY